MSVTASEQFPLCILTRAAEFLPFSSPGHGQRTSSADRARHGEGGTKHQELSPVRSEGREDPGQQEATHGAPPSKARKRHAIKPPTALDNHEDLGEYDAGNKAERSKQEGKWEVGIETGHPRHQDAGTKPCCSPDEALPDCRADTSSPRLHEFSRPQLARFPRADSRRKSAW